MSHIQTVAGSHGDWTFILPDQITLTQSGAGTDLVLDGTPQDPLVFHVRFDLDAYKNPGSSLVIQVLEPAANIDGDASMFGLRGPIEIRFYNELGVPIHAGADGALGIFLSGPGNIPDNVNFHTTYAHFHGVQGQFGNNPVSVDVSLTPGNILAPDVITVGGSILPFAEGVQWGPITLHQRQILDKDDDFTLTFFLKPGAVSNDPEAPPSAVLVTSQRIDTRNLPLNPIPPEALDTDDPAPLAGLLSSGTYAIEVGYDTGDDGDVTTYSGEFNFKDGFGAITEGTVREIQHRFYEHDYSTFPETYFETGWSLFGIRVPVADMATLSGIALGAVIFAGDDYLNGSEFDDALFGFDGDDKLLGGAGADLLDGGPGSDTASYEGSPEGVIIDLAAGTASGGHANGDQLISIENLIGSSHDDILTASDIGGTLDGLYGDDQLFGGAGFDTLIGGDGDDVLDGGPVGAGSGNYLLGGAGNDTYLVRQAFDIVDEGFLFPAHPGQPGDFNTIISRADFHWDLYSVATRHEIAAANPHEVPALVGSLFDSTMIGHQGSSIIFTVGGNNIVRPGDGIDFMAFGSIEGYTGVDTLVLERHATGPASWAAVWSFDPGEDVVDLTDFGYGSFAEVMARGTDDDAGNCYFLLGDTSTDVLFLVGLQLADLSAGNFVV